MENPSDELGNLRIVEVDAVLYDVATKLPIARVSDMRYANLLACSAAMFSALTQLGTILDAVIRLAEDAGNDDLAAQLQQTTSDIQLVRRCAVEGATAVFVDGKTGKGQK